MEGRGWEILWQLRELRAGSVQDNFKIDGGMRESQVKMQKKKKTL